MKNLKHLSLTFTILVVSTISMPMGTQSRVYLQPNNAKLIEETCHRTPFPNLCLQFLKSDPRSSTASDVKDLALVAVDVIKGKTNDALHKIQELLQGPGGEIDNKALNSCVGYYNAILEVDVPKANEALKSGDPKFVEDAARDSISEANACDNNFNGYSPLVDESYGVRNAAEIARAIATILD